MKYLVLFFLSFGAKCAEGIIANDPDFGIGNGCAYLKNSCDMIFLVQYDLDFFNTCQVVVDQCRLLSKKYFDDQVVH